MHAHPEEASRGGTNTDFRWLPIHEAVMISPSPPASTVDAIIKAFPQGMLTPDEGFGNVPLDKEAMKAFQCHPSIKILQLAF